MSYLTGIRRRLCVSLSICCLMICLHGCQSTPVSHSFKPKGGFVPDRETAIQVGRAILISVYGKARVDECEPLEATLKDGVWTVEGTLPEGYRGGVAKIKISQDDGRVLEVRHGK